MTTFRLARGVPAPRQGGDTTCGPAALTVARMVVDPALAQWVVTADSPGPRMPLLRSPRGAATPAARFAAYEAEVHARVTSSDGGRRLPWPRALGTPPWGARAELEGLARPPGTRYRCVLVRFLDPARRRRLLEHMSAHVTETRPGVVYVGSALLPRHVALLVSAPEGLLVYDPGDGSVEPLEIAGVSAARHSIGGWSMPWWFIAPVGHLDDSGSVDR
ncbi:MAG: hypothetical protein V9F04_11885 [Dermatophilaceae bacterium]